MPYGTIKVDTITFTAGGADTSVSISGLVQNPTFTGNITTTGTVTAATVVGTTTVSGATVTGTQAQFTVITGGTAGFTTITGTTVTGTTANFATVSGTTVTGTTGNFGGTVTAATVVGTTTVSGATVTGNAGSFTTVTGGVATITSGVFATGAEALPSISFSSDPNTGIYSPGADQVAISTNGSGQLFVDASGNVGVGAAPVVTFAGQTHLTVNHSAGGTSVAGYNLAVNGTKYASLISYPSNSEALRITADSATLPITFHTNSSERMRLDSSGRLGLGTSSPAVLIHGSVSSGAATARLENTANSGEAALQLFGKNSSGTVRSGSFKYDSSDYFRLGTTGAVAFAFETSDTERMRITSSGNVGIGDTGPTAKLVCNGHVQVTGNGVPSAGAGLEISYGQINAGRTSMQSYNRTGSAYLGADFDALDYRFYTSNSERCRIDSSGRFLVGTSTTSSNTTILAQGNSGGGAAGVIRITSTASSPANGDDLGVVAFGDSAHGTNATIFASRDGGTWSASSKPSRLVFSTTADGASSPTERMRIQNDGVVMFGTTTAFSVVSSSATGAYVSAASGLVVARNADVPAFFLRQTDDGDLIRFVQGGNTEGSISVSGSTVSYNGAHLSRWSQLPGGATREEILRGTVLSNIDEMCAWGEEENEQLNRMKVSDVEGDPNVAGVFQCWDDDDDTYTDDFYCAMTGDFIIRIAEGVTVQRGDLLMSAGDGTAKPQEDDIIRSKTIAKVTSTHITCTYDDGSYCVPCVLMAC